MNRTKTTMATMKSFLKVFTLEHSEKPYDSAEGFQEILPSFLREMGKGSFLTVWGAFRLAYPDLNLFTCAKDKHFDVMGAYDSAAGATHVSPIEGYLFKCYYQASHCPFIFSTLVKEAIARFENCEISERELFESCYYL